MVCPDAVREKISTDVSFVGSLYNEDHNFYDRLHTISDYTRGYLDSIMAAQQQIYGAFFLEQLLTPPILEDLQKCIPYSPMPDGTESAAYVYANYFLCRKITSNERLSLLKAASEQYSLKLYTHQKCKELPNAEFMGTVDYYDTMPLIFQNSRINLNITLKVFRPVFLFAVWTLWEAVDFFYQIFRAIFWIILFRERILSTTKVQTILPIRFPTICHTRQNASRLRKIV